MKSIKKRLLSLLLTLITILSLLPTSTLAASGTGKGITITKDQAYWSISGFPLASVRCGIEPIWASEIEPFPILVSKIRFPRMEQMGDITKLNGAYLPPVDIICGGSPCQDSAWPECAPD